MKFFLIFLITTNYPKLDGSSLMLKGLINRIQEAADIKAFIAEDQIRPRIKILSAKPRSGLTYFLRYSSTIADQSEIFLYADGSKHEGNSLFSQLIIDLFDRHRSIWSKFYGSLEKYGGRSEVRQLSTAAVESIPYLGRVAARATDLKVPTFSTSSYSSIAAELFCKLLVEVSEKHRICLFLDNVQELDDWSAQLLSSTVGSAYKGIRYIAGFVNRETSKESTVNGFALKSEDIGYRMSIEPFPSPDANFIKLYASSHNVDWPMSHCDAIASAADGDIYKIRSAISIGLEKKDGESMPREFSSIDNSIRALLAISKQNLRLSDLLTITLDDETVFVRDEEQVFDSIQTLSSIDEIRSTVLPDGDKLISLQPFSEDVIKELANSYVERTRLESKLYDYFSRAETFSNRHSKSEIAPLLFRLGKRVDPENLNSRLREIIRLSLQMGSRTTAEDFVNCAINSESDSQSLQDYLARLAFLVSVKRFSEVLEQTEHPQKVEWKQNRVVEILRGVALNRCRRHAESESLFEKLCEDLGSSEETVIVVSYRIVGRIHANDVIGARRLFETYQPQLQDARNYGYFLRNGAEVYASPDGIEILSEALQYHEKNSDTFGIATTLCNRGAKRAQIGLAEEGLSDVERAYDMLEVFGTNHLGIVAGDLAHCYLYMGLYELAQEHCRKALRYMGKDLPRIYTLINLAASQLLMGHKSDAVSSVDNFVAESEGALVDRIRQKAFFNGALISAYAGASNDSVQSLCSMSLQYPDRWNPREMAGRIARLRDGEIDTTDMSTFFDLFSPCSLYYWYQNPLEGLPGNFLTTKAPL